VGPDAREEDCGMHKALRCRLYRHKWESLKNADGEAYDRCQRCGTDRGVDLHGRDPNATIIGMEMGAVRNVGLSLGRSRRRPESTK